MWFEFTAWQWWRWKWFESYYCGPMSLRQRPDWAGGHWVKIITAILRRDNAFLCDISQQYRISVSELWTFDCWGRWKMQDLVFYLSKLYFFLNESHGNVNTPGRVSPPISKFNHCCWGSLCQGNTHTHTHSHSHSLQRESLAWGRLLPSFSFTMGSHIF